MQKQKKSMRERERILICEKSYFGFYRKDGQNRDVANISVGSIAYRIKPQSEIGTRNRKARTRVLRKYFIEVSFLPRGHDGRLHRTYDVTSTREMGIESVLAVPDAKLKEALEKRALEMAEEIVKDMGGELIHPITETDEPIVETGGLF